MHFQAGLKWIRTTDIKQLVMSMGQALSLATEITLCSRKRVEETIEMPWKRVKWYVHRQYHWLQHVRFFSIFISRELQPLLANPTEDCEWNTRPVSYPSTKSREWHHLTTYHFQSRWLFFAASALSKPSGRAPRFFLCWRQQGRWERLKENNFVRLPYGKPGRQRLVIRNTGPSQLVGV